MDPKQIKIRNATIKDVKKIAKLVSTFAKQGLMLKRKEEDIIQNLRDYYVAVRPRKKILVGCAALHIYTDRLSEIKALVVRPKYQSYGIGARLVKRCIKEARDLGIPKVFALTYAVNFFSRLGFGPSNKDLLPEKIWAECAKCSRRDNCDENCLVYVVK